MKKILGIAGLIGFTCYLIGVISSALFNVPIGVFGLPGRTIGSIGFLFIGILWLIGALD